ncbi:MAG: hypothetical protein ACRCV5_10950, partial [Afipia sp.]
MIYMRNITITTAKSATYLENVGYKGALVPGLVLTGLYITYILIISALRPSWVPALPKEARTL